MVTKEVRRTEFKFIIMLTNFTARSLVCLNRQSLLQLTNLYLNNAIKLYKRLNLTFSFA